MMRTAFLTISEFAFGPGGPLPDAKSEPEKPSQRGNGKDKGIFSPTETESHCGPGISLAGKRMRTALVTILPATRPGTEIESVGSRCGLGVACEGGARRSRRFGADIYHRHHRANWSARGNIAAVVRCDGWPSGPALTCSLPAKGDSGNRVGERIQQPRENTAYRADPTLGW
jgi:hypothetical protein